MIRRFLVSALALPAVLLAVGVAAAQTPSLEVHIREVSFDSENRTRVVVSVAGPALPEAALSADAFEVTEQGAAQTGLQIEPLLDRSQVAVALLVDVSQSTRPKLAAAKAAANRFLDGLPDEVRAGLITFGSDVVTPVQIGALGGPGSPKRTELAEAIAALRPAPRIGTKLYDAVVAATGVLGRQTGAQRNAVIFSDGDDGGSTAKRLEAVQALGATRTAATSVLLSTNRADERTLQALANATDGGGFVRVENAPALQAAFTQVAQAIASQYVLTYVGTAQEPSDLTIDVAVAAGAARASDAVAVVNERASVAAAVPAAGPNILSETFASRIWLVAAIGAIFLALLLFVGLLFYAPPAKRAEKLLARGLRMYTARGKEKKQKTEGSALSSTALGRAAVGLADRVPRSKDFDERMQQQLDRAGWPLRSTEFILIQVAAVAIGGLLGFVLLRAAPVGVGLMLLGAAAPRLVLANTITRRESAFLSQLPDTLQLLAGSLQAGYGFMQALDTVAKEANPPTSTEFARVLAEARLGMPVEEALDTMADRVGGEDFKWVVLAINIQRQVGGNLAQLLTTVADTLREREQVRRQIKVLSAEGRLSAVILTALPFVLVGYLSVINPEYLGSLTGEPVGRIAIVVALILMGIGGVWMRKIIKIDV